ncbi:class I SAM-dependent methyltransferase, partial [Mycobacterium kyorinense]|uniref:class I SAM-dependent methyltransferase n=1 Tax=Mycobacterium kyorinense TaxID=487514 RepID=UPI0018D42083
EAFDAFKKERYAAFFERARDIMPDDGRMLLHSLFTHPWTYWHEHDIPVTMSDLRFMRFISQEIFPGGRLPQVDIVDKYSTEAGFDITRHHFIGKNYVRTLDTWAKALEAHKDQAIELKGEQMYETFIKYLTGCRELFRDGYTNVCQFTMEKNAA